MGVTGIMVAVACAVVVGGCGIKKEDQRECEENEERGCVPEHFDPPHCTAPEQYHQYCYNGEWGPCECYERIDPPEATDIGEVPSDPLPDIVEIPPDVPDPVDVPTDLPVDDVATPDPDDLDAEDVEDEG